MRLVASLLTKACFFQKELNQFLIVSVTFIGFAYAVRQGRNIRMTAVYDSLNTKAQESSPNHHWKH
ncbi:TRAP transporter small permease subunit [Vibrio lentus]|nr:TRAP transporter small permease subunit [Vibrio lentus]